MAQTLLVLVMIVAAWQEPAPVLNNADLMGVMVRPAYDELRQAIATPPRDRKAWALLYQKAARLAEVENLIFFRGRAEASRTAEWAAKAGAARQASAEVAAAALTGLRNARRADFDSVRAAFPTVSAGCNACHRAFAREAPAIKP